MHVNPDAQLFEVLHELIEDGAAHQTDERRNNDRKDFRCRQLMAPFDGSRLPSQGEFVLAECHDLSPCGFSYFAQRPPQQTQLIVALGQVPFTFVAAEVVNIRANPHLEGGDLLVGCRFLHRVAV